MNYLIRFFTGALALVLCIPAAAEEQPLTKADAAKTLHRLVWAAGKKFVQEGGMQAAVELTMGDMAVTILAAESPGGIHVLLRRKTNRTDDFFFARIADSKLNGDVNSAAITTGEWKGQPFALTYDPATGMDDKVVYLFWQQKYWHTLYYCLSVMTQPPETVAALIKH